MLWNFPCELQHYFCDSFLPFFIKGKQQTEAPHNSQLLLRSQLIPGMGCHAAIEVPLPDDGALHKGISRLPSRALYPVAISQEKKKKQKKNT